MSSRNRDLSLSTGSDNLCKASHHIGLIKTGHDLTLKLFRNKISAVCLDTLGKHVVNKSLATKMCPEVLLIGIGSTTGLFLNLLGRSSGQRLVHRLIKLLLPCIRSLLSVDGSGKILDLLLHTTVSGTVLCRQDAVFVLMGIHEILRSLPNLCSLLNQFIDSHNSTLH